MDPMEEDKQWAVEMAAKLQSYDPVQESSAWKNQSIYKVPNNLIDSSKQHAYSPQLISFGPYHHGRPHLIPMEEHKERALLHFLRRTSIPLQAILDSLNPVEEQLRSQYDDQASLPDSDGLLKMMLLDGCFMLEILRMEENAPGDYTSDDPIFSERGVLYVLPRIKRDMLMLENQIPLLVLDRLVAAETKEPSSAEGHLHRLVLAFFSSNRETIYEASAGDLGLHVLDVYRKGLIVGPAPLGFSPFLKGKEMGARVRSVTELYKAGIRCRMNESGSLTDIEFRDGVLSLPRTLLDETSESSLLNLLAFERLHVGAGNKVGSYVSFMDAIISSTEDVALLQSKGIILNAFGSDEAVAGLFSDLSRDITVDPNSKVGEALHSLCCYSLRRNVMFSVWKTYFLHTYLRSPWTFISLLAAIVLLVLTVVQTIYTVLSYNLSLKQNSSSPPPSR